jgi:hypothetical protein
MLRSHRSHGVVRHLPSTRRGRETSSPASKLSERAAVAAARVSECVAPLESSLTLAFTEVVPPGPIVSREAATLSTSQGLVLTLPDVGSLPVVFGPGLIFTR